MGKTILVVEGNELHMEAVLRFGPGSQWCRAADQRWARGHWSDFTVWPDLHRI